MLHQFKGTVSEYCDAFRNLNQQKKRFIYFSLVTTILLSGYLIVHLPPRNYPTGEIFSVSAGQSLYTISSNLYDAGAIRSTVVFRSHVIFLGGEKRVIAGDYLLQKKEGPADLAFRLVNGEFDIETKRITIPEGWNIYEISDYLSKNLLNFNKDYFILISKKKEGYLFPDTYFVQPTIKTEDLVRRMTETFFYKVPKVSGFATTTKNISEVITMASILEREAITMESRRIISGILWKRLKLGMPLQVDASFSYVNGKTTFELTLDDLKIDSPYNTYLYKGFPPSPIGNPGLDSIFAAVNPIESKYLYYLTGHDGKMYYAKTFEEHKRNKEKYLK
jgi:UPF0755 protein